MADPRNACPSERSNVKYLDRLAYKKDKEALIEDIRKLNGQNYVVVVPGGVEDQGKKFERLKDVKVEYSLAVDGSLDLQYHGWASPFLYRPNLINLILWIDLKKRAKHEEAGYHIPTTVSDFVENVNNPDVVGMVLDIPICTQALPAPYKYIFFKFTLVTFTNIPSVYHQPVVNWTTALLLFTKSDLLKMRR